MLFSFSGESLSADGVGDAGGGSEADGEAPEVLLVVDVEAEDFFLGEKKEGIGQAEKHEITMGEEVPHPLHTSATVRARMAWPE